MQQEEGEICRKKIKEERRWNGHGEKIKQGNSNIECGKTSENI